VLFAFKYVCSKSSRPSSLEEEREGEGEGVESNELKDNPEAPELKSAISEEEEELTDPPPPALEDFLERLCSLRLWCLLDILNFGLDSSEEDENSCWPQFSSDEADPAYPPSVPLPEEFPSSPSE
jgi:hypothetical protein